MFDLMITGGTVVLPNEAALVDVGIQDGRIAAIAAPGTLTDDAARTLDASGRIVTPGGIEPHIHAAANVQAGAHQLVAGVPNAGPLEHSLGAIWGGTTTVVDFAPAPREGDWSAASTIFSVFGMTTLTPTIRPTSYIPAATPRTVLLGLVS